jgi:nitrogenase molybdenum-iron protein alpha/beta subunit
MPDCTNPLWPCAMTGAAACLAGFDGIAVVIHGSSGCYYYPATLLHTPLTGTFILEQEVIFGSEARLHEVLNELGKTGQRVAVVTTCVPAILGEDIRGMLSAHDVILVDSPGFSGSFETGFKKALSILNPVVDPGVPGVNIDGVSLFDPFYRGNMMELIRLLTLAHVPVGTILCSDKFSRLSSAAPFTIRTDDDLASGIGTCLGGTLGFDSLRTTFMQIADRMETADPDPVLREIIRAEERLVAACDKYLRRFAPPRAAIFSGLSYASFTAHLLEKYLDADIVFIGSRTDLQGDLPYPAEKVTGLPEVQERIRVQNPDLVIGSSFERSVRGNAAFVALTPPLRGTIRLSTRPIAGIEGTLLFMEAVLNACMDKRAPAR